MNLQSSAAVGRHRKPVRSIVFTASLVLAAMLLSLLAMHSMIGSHDSISHTADSAAHEDVRPAGAEAEAFTTAGAVAAVIPLIAHADVGILGCADCMLVCAVWAMTCAILLVLAALIVLARSPSTYRRLLDAGGRVIALFQGPALHLFRPSLVVLSISRT
ncbi:hypothetical protein K2F54_18110 [Cryobacterium sp. 1639]|uniref:hypothetical protein n=1 Tax=Cryobacterium inferilacus TaxID=2866629 RepID=UPI001C7371AF|nr:hypothetical protein [Cryobacterium sp. 1639]MBX0301883.1 hypothetical protein [Cryobacterium sp. 1639]